MGEFSSYIRLLFVFMAIASGIILHKLKDINNFVDDRKNQLRASLRARDNELSDNYLPLIQHIGKYPIQTKIISELLGNIHSSYAIVAEEIEMLRDRYSHLYQIGRIVFVISGLVLSLFIYDFYLKLTLSYEDKAPPATAYMLTLIAIVLLIVAYLILVYIFKQTSLGGMNFLTEEKLGEVIDINLANAYSWTYKDRRYILSSSDNEKKVSYCARYKSIAEKIDAIAKDSNKPIEVLDMGCGDGLLESFLSENNIKVTGIDVSPASIDAANSKAKPGNQYNVCNAIDYAKSSDDKYDVVVLSDILEHFVSPKTFLANVMRLLGANGVLIVTLPSADNERNKELAYKALIADNINNGGFMIHWWTDPETSIRFPHYLYTQNKARKLFDDIIGEGRYEITKYGRSDGFIITT